jgi:hypothetical protein
MTPDRKGTKKSHRVVPEYTPWYCRRSVPLFLASRAIRTKSQVVTKDTPSSLILFGVKHSLLSSFRCVCLPPRRFFLRGATVRTCGATTR